MKEKQQIIEYWKSHLRDLIPYDSPNYEEELQKAAEELYEAEINGEFNQNEKYSGELIEIIWD
jgi:Leu/Phe-tRNA-protein transferase